VEVVEFFFGHEVTAGAVAASRAVFVPALDVGDILDDGLLDFVAMGEGSNKSWQ
jgi:hypothetical protein